MPLTRILQVGTRISCLGEVLIRNCQSKKCYSHQQRGVTTTKRRIADIVRHLLTKRSQKIPVCPCGSDATGPVLMKTYVHQVTQSTSVMKSSARTAS